MFISKEKFQDKLDLIENYRKRYIDKHNEVGNLKIINKKLETKIEYLEGYNRTLEENNACLIKEQEKLIDWIEKIINDVGCYTVNERDIIRIPMYRMDGPAYDTEFNGVGFTPEREVIVLPKIEILKETYGGSRI